MGRDPQAGGTFGFRGRRGDLVALLWHDGLGLSLHAKRLEAGPFIRPARSSGAAPAISAAPLAVLLDGIDRGGPRRTRRPAKAGGAGVIPVREGALLEGMSGTGGA